MDSNCSGPAGIHSSGRMDGRKLPSLHCCLDAVVRDCLSPIHFSHFIYSKPAIRDQHLYALVPAKMPIGGIRCSLTFAYACFWAHWYQASP
jgi:hypothetical protein